MWVMFCSNVFQVPDRGLITSESLKCSLDCINVLLEGLKGQSTKITSIARVVTSYVDLVLVAKV